MPTSRMREYRRNRYFYVAFDSKILMVEIDGPTGQLDTLWSHPKLIAFEA